MSVRDQVCCDCPFVDCEGCLQNTEIAVLQTFEEMTGISNVDVLREIFDIRVWPDGGVTYMIPRKKEVFQMGCEDCPYFCSDCLDGDYCVLDEIDAVLGETDDDDNDDE